MFNSKSLILCKIYQYYMFLSQVWFQNARAKYRRHMLKQETGKTEDGQDVSTEFRLSDDEKSRDKSYTEMSNNSSSSLSDIGSTQSLSDIQSGMAEFEHPTSSLSELFTSTISTIN